MQDKFHGVQNSDDRKRVFMQLLGYDVVLIILNLVQCMNWI